MPRKMARPIELWFLMLLNNPYLIGHTSWLLCNQGNWVEHKRSHEVWFPAHWRAWLSWYRLKERSHRLARLQWMMEHQLPFLLCLANIPVINQICLQQNKCNTYSKNISLRNIYLTITEALLDLYICAGFTKRTEYVLCPSPILMKN